MSEHALPDDLAAWPSDPYEVLGVEATDDDRAIRRAYARLVKQFKPEVHPEHFQRLREAHDAAREGVKWRTRFAAHHEPETDGWEDVLTSRADIDPPVHRTFDDGDAPDAGSTASFRDDVDAEIDDAWRAAEVGDLRTAYDRLRSLAGRRHGHPGVAVRLYWLLWIDDSLDERDPVDWLVEGLGESGPRGPLWELYKQAIGVPPVQPVTHEPPLGVNGAVDGGRLVDLALARIEATSWRGLWTRLRADLDRLRDPIQDGYGEQWTHIVGRALEHVSWWRGQESAEALRRDLSAELEALSRQYPGIDDVFDRAELLAETVEAVHRMRGDSRLSEVGALVRDSWAPPIGGIERRLFRCLANWQRNPRSIMENLDRATSGGWGIGENGALVLHQFRHLVDAYVRHDLFTDLAGDVARQLCERCRVWSKYDYGSIRPEVLEVCLAEWVTVDQLLECCFTPGSGIPAPLHEFLGGLNSDLSLRIVVSGLRALSDAAEP